MASVAYLVAVSLSSSALNSGRLSFRGFEARTTTRIAGRAAIEARWPGRTATEGRDSMVRAIALGLIRCLEAVISCVSAWECCDGCWRRYIALSAKLDGRSFSRRHCSAAAIAVTRPYREIYVF